MKNNVLEVKNISLIKNHTRFKKKNKYFHFQKMVIQEDYTLN